MKIKRLLALIFAAGLVGCAEQPPPPVVNAGYPYSRYSTTAEVWGYRSGIYANWTTAQLQQRRLDLYGRGRITAIRITGVYHRWWRLFRAADQASSKY